MTRREKGDMKKEDKRIITEIIQNTELERNLPAYAGAYINAAYEYSLIHLVLNYYTMKEIEADTRNISRDSFLSDLMGKIHTILFQTILAEERKEDYTEYIEEIHFLRSELMKKMTILTAYTDAMQLYEYVLNRIEYGITGEEIPVEESELAAKVFQYLFQDNDTMVVNSKIQMVTGQLPIRMTKSRFFDYLTDTLNIYNGSDKSAVDDFVEMLKSTALLELPAGYGEEYKEIADVIQLLEQVDFKSLDLNRYQALMEQFSFTTEHLTELVSNYLLAAEIINDFYAALLALPFERNENTETKTSVQMLQGLHDAFVADGEIPDIVDDGFALIEGVQEALGEDIIRFDSILPDVLSGHKDTISWVMSETIFNSLSKISKLLSNSLFIELEGQEQEEESADADYITKKRDELVGRLSEFFGNHTKEMNRAVMAALFSSMPVLFNSQQEIRDYIEYSLNHCGNSSELMACAKILEDMMEEE